jgi:hypothetical protein
LPWTIVDGNHVIDRRRTTITGAVQPPFWGGPLIGFRAPHPRTLEIVERSFTPNPDDDPLLVDADQRRNPGDGNLWTFRRIAARRNFVPGAYASDICLVNWPMIDYLEAPIIDVPEEEKTRRLGRAAELSMAVFYWLQTEAPRVDGGQGFPGLRLRGDVTGHRTRPRHGALHPRKPPHPRGHHHRGTGPVICRPRRGRGGPLPRQRGRGMYRIDLHPSTGGDNYIDVPSCPFEIPLGALLPRRMTNLIAAGKMIGTTHITNGCYRLHPVEWNVGEAAGWLAAHCLATGNAPHAVQADDALLGDFIQTIERAGVETRWPDIRGY